MNDKLEGLGNPAREIEGWLSEWRRRTADNLAKQVPREQAIVELGEMGKGGPNLGCLAI